MRPVKLLFGLLCVSFLAGCMWDEDKPEAAAPPKAEEKTGVFGKKTQEIGVFDPNAAQRVSDQKIHATDPITAPLAAYGPTVEKISILAVDQAIRVFQAIEDRYPRDHAEFMEKIIRANNIQLPVLPYKGEYKYDEKLHTLVVVYPEAPPADANAKK